MYALVDHYGYKVKSNNVSFARFIDISNNINLTLENHENISNEGIFYFNELRLTMNPPN